MVGSRSLVTDRLFYMLDKLELSFNTMALCHEAMQRKGSIA